LEGEERTAVPISHLPYPPSAFLLLTPAVPALCLARSGSLFSGEEQRSAFAPDGLGGDQAAHQLGRVEVLPALSF